MKGIVFTTLAQMVEVEFGMDVLNDVLDVPGLSSGGIYTAGETYDDAELLTLVGELSRITNIEPNKLVYSFGVYSLGQFAKLYPVFFKEPDAKSFLKKVHGVIHVEVKKLYPEAQLPDFQYEEPESDKLIMHYRSHRKFCKYAEGLIEGAAKHYGIHIEQKQTTCMHDGDDHCRFELVFVE